MALAKLCLGLMLPPFSDDAGSARRTPMFLKDSWYVAAFSHEVKAAPRPSKLVGEKVVLYRREDGTPVALEDACPHRKLPLSMGRLKGDQIECGYHGLTFDCGGVCTRVPGAEKVP